MPVPECPAGPLPAPDGADDVTADGGHDSISWLSSVWSLRSRRWAVPLAAGLLGDLVQPRTELIAEDAMLRQQMIVADAGGHEAWVATGGRQRALLRPPRP
jgi:hypothetical protein